MTSVIILLASLTVEPRLPPPYTCADVRDNVAKYGYLPALAWAKLNGFTKEQIAEAKRCLRK